MFPDEPNSDSPSDGTTPSASDSGLASAPHRFYTGEKLTVDEASKVIHGYPARVVFCVGAQWSGKTTFLARIGEMFRDGSFADYRFAGSLTLCAFERATWRATIASGAETPDTPRTHRRENDTFLHLRVYPKDDAASRHELLISDLAGETFPTAVASREFCADLRSLARANDLVVFLDCAKLVDQVKRHPESDNARTFLQQVVAIKYQPKALRVHVVFSRWDYITRHPDRAAQEAFCEGIRRQLTDRFAHSFGSVDFWKIAARPDGGTPATNGEIQALFARWLEAPVHMPAPRLNENRHPVRDFSGFGLK